MESDERVMTLVASHVSASLSYRQRIGDIAGLEVYEQSREIVVTGDRASTKRIYLEPTLFAFLYYLAEERAQGEEGWLVKHGNKKDYQILRADLWESICTEFEGRHNPDNQAITRFATLINKKVSRYHDLDSEPLIKVPNRGKQRPGTTSVYCLNPSITSVDVKFHGRRIKPLSR